MAEKFIIAVDLGGTNLKIALLDSKYRIKVKEYLDTTHFRNKKRLISVIINFINKIINNNKLKRLNILGIGLGLPGPIDVEKGIVHFFPNIPGWNNVNLKKILQKKLKFPIFLDNDVNLMALAEFRKGAAKGYKNAVCLTLGTGVGGGIIIDSKLYRGSNFSAGEIGHIPINERGPRCNCGGVACLEAYVGNKRILKEARRSFKRNVSLEELSHLANTKNRKARAIWARVARHLGIGLVGVINLINPDIIVIGGGVANAGKVLFNEVKETILKRAMTVPAGHVKVVKAKLGNNAGLIGAAILVREGIS